MPWPITIITTTITTTGDPPDGVDVSHWQGDIDWDAVAADDICCSAPCRRRRWYVARHGRAAPQRKARRHRPRSRQHPHEQPTFHLPKRAARLIRAVLDLHHCIIIRLAVQIIFCDNGVRGHFGRAQPRPVAVTNSRYLKRAAESAKHVLGNTSQGWIEAGNI